jgi:hypothetical protein
VGGVEEWEEVRGGMGEDVFLGRISGAMRRKPGFPLQFLAIRFAVCSGLSAAIPCAVPGGAFTP